MLLDTHNAYQFPGTIRHESGAELRRDPSRFLLGFKHPHSLSDVNGLTSSLADLFRGLQLEQDAAYRKTAQKVNNTQNHYWFNSLDQRDIEIDKIEDLAEGYLDLGWVGPVYEFSKSENAEYRLCVLPDTLLIRPTERYKSQGDQLDEMLEDYGLVHVPGLTKLLAGFRYYTFVPSRARKSTAASVYRVQELLTINEQFKDVVLTAVFDYMPMLVSRISTPDIGRTQSQPDPTDIRNRRWVKKPNWHLPSIINSFRLFYGNIFRPLQTDFAQEIVCAAVIDQAGVQLDHPAFNPPGLPSAFVSGATFYPDVGFDTSTGKGPVYIDYTSSTAGDSDDDPHGTLCAGIIAARYNSTDPAPNSWKGMAPEDLIMPLKVIGFKKSLIAAAITFAAQGAAVVSISDSDESLDGSDPLTNPVESAIEDAVNKQGVVICASTANFNQKTFHYPASHPLVLGCGACNQYGNRCTAADWGNNRGSNYGDGLSGTVPTGSGLSVVALGVSITSTDLTDYPAGGGQRGIAIGDYVQNFWGTSAAAPQVAALAVLIIHNFPVFYRSYPQIRYIIESTAKKVGCATVDASGNLLPNPYLLPTCIGPTLVYKTTMGRPNGTWNWEMGYGLIDVASALAMAKQMSQSYADRQPPAAPAWLRVS